MGVDEAERGSISGCSGLKRVASEDATAGSLKVFGYLVGDEKALFVCFLFRSIDEPTRRGGVKHSGS